MNFREYQKKAMVTAQYGDTIDQLTNCPVATKLLRIAYVGLGLGEIGEVQGKLKKIIRDSGGKITEEVRQKVAAEAGDVLWYLAALCTEFDLKLEDVAIGNINKLVSRKERGTLRGSGDQR